MRTVFAALFPAPRRPVLRLLLKAKVASKPEPDGKPEAKLLASIPAPGKTFADPRVDQDGAHQLGQTRSKKPVFASGAEAGGFSKDEHAEAGRLHLQAHAHHDARATEHEKKAKGEKDWRVAEAHQRDAEHHSKLSDHHFDRAREHLQAAGRGSSIGLHHAGGNLVLGVKKPSDPKEQEEAKQAIAKRTHADHPGGIGQADKTAYRNLA
jgi:hypothetical protein